MSRHIDLIAVGALLVAFALASHLHDALHLRLSQARVFRIHTLSPVVVAPPRVPSVPHLSRLPHLPHV